MSADLWFIRWLFVRRLDPKIEREIRCTTNINRNASEDIFDIAKPNIMSARYGAKWTLFLYKGETATGSWDSLVLATPPGFSEKAQHYLDRKLKRRVFRALLAFLSVGARRIRRRRRPRLGGYQAAAAAAHPALFLCFLAHRSFLDHFNPMKCRPPRRRLTPRFAPKRG